MRSRPRDPVPWRACLVIVVAVLAAGCSRSGPDRFRVSGTVTHAGQPVALGRIVFEPDASRGNSGPQGFAPIENGRYDTATPNCKGSVGGPMIVMIDGLKLGGGDDVAASGMLLFPTHQERVDMPRSGTTLDFDVPNAAGPVR